MQRIFLAPEQIQDGLAHIAGTDHQHLARVMRARVGESVIVLDGQGNAFRAELVTIGKSESAARIVNVAPVPPEPYIHLTILQALGKGDKFEQVVQHGTEAGASEFAPLRAERCVVDVPAAKAEEHRARWQQIAKSAAEQSGRGIIPTVRPLIDYSRLISSSAARERVTRHDLLILHTDASAMPLKRALQTMPISALLNLAIGPEGGWSPAELKAAQEADIPLVSLGPRVLRTETAALVAISQILYHFETV